VYPRITIHADKRGQPCIRGLRITVWGVLWWSGSGLTEQQILEDHPDLEREDFRAISRFAAEVGRNANVQGEPGSNAGNL
jgi:uncharacterized protein (DUF433 family)